MKKKIVYIFLFLAPFFVIAQSEITKLDGQILDADTKAPLSGVIITAYGQDQTTIVGYTTSNATGHYTLELTSQQVSIIFALLGYESTKLAVDGQPAIKRNILLKQRPIKLREVKIKPPRITYSRDTVRYQVDQFAQNMDRTIGDVLKKLPGIEVTESGAVLYNGKAINRFYIEGMNLLDEKYGLAVNNVDFRDVNQVEILENHQPIKVLEETVGSDRAALNLKLKDSSKGKWVGNITTGIGGSPLLWDVSAMAMEVSAKRQSINVVKTNNTGNNISKDVESQSIEDIINGVENDVEIDNPLQMEFVPPNLSESRYYFNQSILANTRSIWSLKHNFTAKATLDYTRDILENQTQVEQAYLTLDSAYNFTEFSDFVSKPSRIDMTLNLNKNVDDFFLDNTFGAKVSWKDTDVQTMGTMPNSQSSNFRQLTLQNDFNYVKLIKNKRISLNSYSRFDQQNIGGLVVYNDSLGINQSMQMASFFHHTHLSGTFNLFGWSVDNRLGWKETIKNVESTLDGHLATIGVVGEAPVNNFQLNETNFYYKPRISYQKSNVILGIDLPINYVIPRLNDRGSQSSMQKQFFFFNPSVDLLIRLNSFFKFSVRGRINNEINTEVLRYLPQATLRNYRLFVVGSDSLERRKLYSFAADFTYRNPVTAVFGSLSFSHNTNINGLLTSNTFEGPVIVQQLLLASNRSSVTRLSGNMGKGIDAWNTSASFKLNYTSSITENVQNQQLITNEIRSWEVTTKLSTAPSSWLNIDYIGNISTNRSVVNTVGQSDPLGQSVQSLKLTFIGSPKISMFTGWEYVYNEISENNSLRQQFIDFGIRYKLSTELALDLKGTNVLNERNFGYTEFSSTATNSSYYILRPANFLLSMYYKF